MSLIRPGLNPPRPTARIDHDLLPGASANDAPRDGFHSFSPPLGGRGNFAEFNGWSGAGLACATAQCKREKQQQRCLPRNWDNNSSHLYAPRDKAPPKTEKLKLNGTVRLTSNPTRPWLGVRTKKKVRARQRIPVPTPMRYLDR